MHHAARVIQHQARDRVKRRHNNILKAQELQLRCVACWSFPPKAPLFPQCCADSIDSPSGCVCFQCLYSFFELDTHPACRAARRTWASCGCVVENALAFHTTDSFVNRLLDTIPARLECFLCRMVHDSQNALVRHLFEECPHLHVSCTHCNAFGPRQHILGPHYRRHHATTTCPICEEDVTSFEAHALGHVRTLFRAISGRDTSEFFVTEVHRLADALLK
jgi:hypothetical protein